LTNSNYNPNLVNHENFFDSVYVLGQLHNEFLDTMYSKISRIKDSIDIFPNIIFDTYAKQQAISFFNNKGYDIITYVDTSDLSVITLDELITSDTTLSYEAMALLVSLNNALNLYANADNIISFINTCDSIIDKSSNLDDSLEQVIISIGASIGKSSAAYWTLEKLELFNNLAENGNNILLISKD